EGVLEAAELGQPHVQRHLPALEAGRHLVAGLGALGAAASGLAALATLTASDADLGALRTGGRTQVVHLQGVRLLRLLGLCHGYLTSSTETRWATVVIMPRTSGRSSRTTLLPIRPRPSERRVWRWFSLPPMADFVCVTLSSAITHPPSRWTRPASPRGPWPRPRRGCAA